MTQAPVAFKPAEQYRPQVPLRISNSLCNARNISPVMARHLLLYQIYYLSWHDIYYGIKYIYYGMASIVVSNTLSIMVWYLLWYQIYFFMVSYLLWY